MFGRARAQATKALVQKSGQAGRAHVKALGLSRDYIAAAPPPSIVVMALMDDALRGTDRKGSPNAIVLPKPHCPLSRLCELVKQDSQFFLIALLSFQPTAQPSH
jgi:hypothetical protein